MKAICGFLLSTMFVAHALAGSIDPHTVTMIQIYGTPSQNFTDVFVSTCPTSNDALTSCVAGSSCSMKTGFILERAHPLFKELYAAVLAARQAGTPRGLLGSGSCLGIGAESLAEIWIPE